MKLHALLLAGLLAASSAHAQVYKCTVGGSVVFSDKPCAAGAQTIDVKPASGRAAPPVSEAENAAAAATSSYVERANNTASRRVLNNQIQVKEGELQRLELEMQAKIRHLQNQRQYANNNLAGATWQNSLAEEMNAVSSSYGTRIEGVRAELDRLRAERERIPAN